MFVSLNINYVLLNTFEKKFKILKFELEIVWKQIKRRFKFLFCNIFFTKT